MVGDKVKWWVRISARVLLVLLVSVALVPGAAWAALWAENHGTPSDSARGTGHDAMWLGHAWVDGRKSQSDVDALVARLRGTGIRDLFVHAGPFADDGTLDPGLRPRARWFIQAIHQALPGVRVQAWLGAHRVQRELENVSKVLDDGFDGIHYDFEPIGDGDRDLLAALRETHALTRQRGVLLSVSAVHNEPWQGMAACLTTLGVPFMLWSEEYLHEVALEVDQVATMTYDTTLPSQATYAGYVRRATEAALRAVPPEVTLLIGVPAYHDRAFYRREDAETVAAALRGVRLALGDRPLAREFGVALYVDFAATEQDWTDYRQGWAFPG